MNETAGSRKVRAAQNGMHVWEWFAIEQADRALQHAELERPTQPDSPMLIRAQACTQLDLTDSAEPRDRRKIDVVLARERCQAAHQFFAWIQRDDVTLRAFAYLHRARKIARDTPITSDGDE
jgi:hypothetical protein